jgi:hypothetical protein
MVDILGYSRTFQKCLILSYVTVIQAGRLQLVVDPVTGRHVGQGCGVSNVYIQGNN